MKRILIAVLLCLIALPCSAGIREASVKISVPDGNGYNVGSGTLVARDADCMYGVTCEHVVRNLTPGRNFNIEIVDGRRGTAKLLDKNWQLDVAVFSCARVQELDIIPIATEAPDDGCPLTISGFPGGRAFSQFQGTIDTKVNRFADKACTIPVCKLQATRIVEGGTSGGSVIQNGRLYGVLATADQEDETIASATDYRQLYRYLETERTNCFGGKCRRVRIIQRGPVSQQPQRPQLPTGPTVYDRPKKPEAPKPDVPAPAPLPDAADPPAPAGQDDKISNLESKIDQLSKQIAGLAASSGRGSPPGKDGQPGPAGTPGKDGRDGKDADPAALSELRSDVAGLKAFRDGLVNQRITVPVKPVPKK